MTKKCNGCGITLQTMDINEVGYTRSIDYNLCERCFRIKNYNDYKMVDKKNIDFIPILESINQTNDLVVLVIDILNVPENLDLIKKYLQNDILIVLSKRDVMPKDIYEEHLLNVADILGIKYVDKILVSSNKNYHFDELYTMINYYKKSPNVYVVGYTNAGKSTLINKIIYNYSKLDLELTTSILPSTTLDMLAINIDKHLTLIDTPGLIIEGSIWNTLNYKTLKKISSLKTIHPKVYQVKKNQTFKIEDFLMINCDNNNIVMYLPNSLKIERFYQPIDKGSLEEHIFNVKAGTDIVIAGLGFIKIIKNGIIKIYLPKEIKVYTRKSIIN